MDDYQRERQRAVRRARGHFERGLRMMRSSDPQASEDGFALLKEIAPEHADELIEAFGQETRFGMRSWLLELIGATRSPKAFDLLVAELSSEHESFRLWAEAGLRQLDSKQARRVLWERGR